MSNVKEVSIIDTAIRGDLLTAIANMAKLRTLSVERVLIVNTVKEIVFESNGIQHLRLLDTTWDGPPKVGTMIRACHALHTLCITWHDEGEEEGVGWESWTNASCWQATVVCKPKTLVSKYERQTLLALLAKLEGMTELHLEGSLLAFTKGDTLIRPFSQSVEKYVGPIHFLNVHRRLPKLKSVTLTNIGLFTSEVNELTIEMEEVTNLKVNVFGGDKHTMCRLLSVTKELRNLEINFSDDVNEPVSILAPTNALI